MARYNNKNYISLCISHVVKCVDSSTIPAIIGEISLIFYGADCKSHTVDGTEIMVLDTEGKAYYFNKRNNPFNNTDLAIELVRTRFPDKLIQVLLLNRGGCHAFVSTDCSAQRKDELLPLVVLEAGLRAILKELPE